CSDHYLPHCRVRSPSTAEKRGGQADCTKRDNTQRQTPCHTRHAPSKEKRHNGEDRPHRKQGEGKRGGAPRVAAHLRRIDAEFFSSQRIQSSAFVAHEIGWDARAKRRRESLGIDSGGTEFLAPKLSVHGFGLRQLQEKIPADRIDLGGSQCRVQRRPVQLFPEVL